MIENPVMLTAEEFQLWKEMPTTKAVYRLFKDEINAIKEELHNEGLVFHPQGQLRQAFLCGEKKSFETLISLTVDDVQEDEYDREDEGKDKSP